MNCYRLAQFYHVHPSTFLNETFSRLDQHLFWTDKITESDRIDQAWQEKLSKG